MTFRKFLLYLHLVFGLIAALELMVLGLTGAILVFGTEIDHSLNADLTYVHPGSQRLPLDALARKLEQAHPGTKLRSLVLPESDGMACRVTLQSPAGGPSLNLTVNPYTGEELGSLNRANNFVSKVTQFHKNLLLGRNGALVTESGGILLLILASSGLVLWWSRKILKPRPGVSGSRFNFDLHNFTGLYSSVFMLIFGVTGIVIHWDNEAAAYLNHLSGAADTPIPKASPAPPGATPLTADGALNAALNAVPGARVTSIQGLGTSNPVRITMKYPEDRTPSGRTNLYLDPVSGQVLSLQTSRTGPPGLRIVKLWNREIHTGDIFGWPTRILACIASLSLPLLAVTGPLIWFLRLQKKA